MNLVLNIALLVACVFTLTAGQRFDCPPGSNSRECAEAAAAAASAVEGHEKFDGAQELKDAINNQNGPQQNGPNGASIIESHPIDDLLKQESQDIELKYNHQKVPPVNQAGHVPIPVPLPMPSQPGHVILPGGAQPNQQQPPAGHPQGPYGGPPGPVFANQPQANQPQQGGYPMESNQVEYGSELQQGAPYPTVGVQGNDLWPLQSEEMPKIVHLDVKCEKNLMKVAIEFDRPFNGIIFSKGHYSYGNCQHLPAGSGRNSVYFDIGINSCGTTGNTQNGLYGYGGQSGSGTFFENTVVIQYDPQVQEVWDQARKLRCTWHDQYEKAVTFRPFPVDMLDVVRADFAGDNVGCWMQIQVGKGPWASEVAGIVKIGQTMTMVLAIKDEDNKFDMLVRNCIAHDGKRAPIELVDSNGCIVRPKLMSRFTKIKNFGSSATVLSYAHFQAFKFPDSMEVHFQCTIQICRYQCPEQCSGNQPLDPYDSYASGSNFHHQVIDGKRREERDVSRQMIYEGKLKYDPQTGQVTQTGHLSPHHHRSHSAPLSTEIGIQKHIQVVSTGDLAFALPSVNQSQASSVQQERVNDHVICLSTVGFAGGLIFLVALLIASSLASVFLYLRHRSAFKTLSMKATNMSTLPHHPHPVAAHHHHHTFSRSQMPNAYDLRSL